MNENKENRKNFIGKVYVTIDTEMDADVHWKKANPPEFTSIYEGIPNILRPIWNRQQVTPIYFVSPEVVRDEKSCVVLREEIKKGAIIGAHLHPEYIEPCMELKESNSEAQFPCFAYEKEIEKEKIENLKKMIELNLGITPLWYRAARYGADSDTIDILRELGFQNESSVTPCVNWSSKNGPNHSELGIERLRDYIISKDSIYQVEENDGQNQKKIREYPITIMGKRWGIIGKFLPENWMFYRWLRPSHMFLWEQKSIIRQAYRMKLENMVMMFHSMEVMVGKTPFVRTKWMQTYYLWRLEKTLAYAKKKGYQP